jgi:hypothetical protein
MGPRTKCLLQFPINSNNWNASAPDWYGSLTIWKLATVTGCGRMVNAYRRNGICGGHLQSLMFSSATPRRKSAAGVRAFIYFESICPGPGHTDSGTDTAKSVLRVWSS